MMAAIPPYSTSPELNSQWKQGYNRAWEEAGRDLNNTQAELDRLRAEVHEANAACDAQVRECNRLQAAMELAERCHLEQATQWKTEIDRLRVESHEANSASDAQIRECNRLRSENAALRQESVKYAQEADRLRSENTGLRSQIAEIRRVVDSWRPKETEG